MPHQPMDHRHVLDHLGLGAGLGAARGLGAVLDQATTHNPARRALSVGEAGKALGRHGLGGGTPARALVPPCCHHKPTYRLLAPRVASGQRQEDAVGRAWDTR